MGWDGSGVGCPRRWLMVRLAVANWCSSVISRCAVAGSTCCGAFSWWAAGLCCDDAGAVELHSLQMSCR